MCSFTQYILTQLNDLCNAFLNKNSWFFIVKLHYFKQLIQTFNQSYFLFFAVINPITANIITKPATVPNI